MKKSFFLFVLVVSLFLASCFDVQETYTLKTDGSYEAKYDMDMSGLMKMVSSFTPDSVKQLDKTKGEVKDTTFNIGSAVPDSAKKKLTVQEFALLQKTDMHMKTDVPNNIMQFSVINKGKSLEEMNYFFKNFGRLMKKSNVDKRIGNKNFQADNSDEGDDKSPFEHNDFDYKVTTTSFERKTKVVDLDAEGEQLKASLKMFKAMGLKLTNTIVINLPRPAKSVNDPKAVLSADKKQVKLSMDMFENLENPKELHLLVNY